MIAVANRSLVARKASAFVLAAILWPGLSLPASTPAATSDPGGLDPAPALEPCIMEHDGYWQGRIFGTTSFDLHWSGAALECAGNERPVSRGLRLFFAGRPDGQSNRLLLVLGIAAPLAALLGREHEVSVTLIDEASSQFFHAPKGRCFTRIGSVQALTGQPHSWRIEGEFYCTGAIAAVSGPGSLTLGDMRFAGRFTEARP